MEVAGAQRKQWRSLPGSARGSFGWQRPQQLASQKPALGLCRSSPVHSLWGLSGFASSSDWVRTGRNKAKCLANHPGCQGLSFLTACRGLSCLLPGILVCSRSSQDLCRSWSWWGRQAWGILESYSPQARGKAATSWAPLDPAGQKRSHFLKHV